MLGNSAGAIVLSRRGEPVKNSIRNLYRLNSLSQYTKSLIQFRFQKVKLAKSFIWVTAHSYRGGIIKISQEEKEAVKKNLLEEAARHFAEKGFEDANINDIAVGAGYAKGTVYNYFRSKEELFGEVIAEAARRTVKRYRSAPVHKSARKSLRELALADVSVLREEESFIKVLAGEAMNPRSDNYGLIMTHLGEFIEMITNILDTGVAGGEIRDDRPSVQLSLAFLGLLTLLYIQHWKSGGNWPALDEIPDLVVTLFLDGAGKCGTGSESEVGE